MQPFVPSNQNLREFSLRAVLIGLVMAVILGSANAYLGLKAGMTIAATYPAAVIGMALIKLMKGTILEENMARTVGSIGESVAAGAIFTIPAFVISGIWPKFFTAGNYVTSSLIMFAGGVLGIMFVALLRRVMVEDAELPYPESVAAAEIHKAGARGGNGTKFLFGAMGLGAAIQALVQIQLFATTWEKFAAFKTQTIDLVRGWQAKVAGGMLLSSPGISPAYMGVGYIIGPKLGALNFSGGIIAWGLLVPIITYFLAPGTLPAGAKPEDWIALSYSVWKFIVRPIAIGGMLVGAGFTLFKMRKSLATGLTRSVSDVKKAASGDHVVERVNKDLPFTYVLGGIAFAAAVTFLVTWKIFHVGGLVSFVAALVMVILGFFFAAISGYLVGIMGSSNNPISGLTLTALVLTALVMVILGVKGQEGVAAVLGVAAIVCVSAAVAGEMLQDLKAGHILGGTPWRMEMGDLLGVALASIVLFIPLMVLHEGDISAQATKQITLLEKNPGTTFDAYQGTQGQYAGAYFRADQVKQLPKAIQPTFVAKTLTLTEVKGLSADSKKNVLSLDAGFGSKQLAAPQAGLMALLSRGIVEGKMAWPLIIVGMMMGFAFILMQVKSPMLVSVGMYLPLETTFAIFLGGLIKGAVEMFAARRGLNEAQKVRVENNGVLLAAGLIAGEALVGLVFAAFAFFEVKYQLTRFIWGVDKEGIANAPGAFWVSLLILAGIAVYLVRVPLANAGAADEPAPPSANF
jgi:putative OPT family oligopeptide transporter